MDFSTLAGDALTEALALDFNSLDADALTAALTERKTAAATLFALTEPTITQVNTAEALVAAIGEVEAEQAKRNAAASDAAARFAAARASFSEGGDVEGDAETEDDAEAEGDADAEQAEAEQPEADDTVEAAMDEEKDVVTASASDSQRVKVSTAKKVAARNKRPAVKAASPVTITAAADVPGFSTGQSLSDMDQVTKALLNRVKGFAPYNESAAKAAYSASGGEPVITQVGLASFGMEFDPSLVASVGNDFAAVRNAIKQREGSEGALTAAGWCAPSAPIYSYIADYVVDGLLTVPEISAPRGGFLLTTGPARSSQGSALADGTFGFTQTEAQAIARTPKRIESIVCPTFTDYRLDAIGYGYTIPILTQKAYPELITDALRFAGVLYAHKVNQKIINDIVALSTSVPFEGYGPSVTDALEVLELVAVKERRKWNIGVNAVMEVKVPEWARVVLRSDMSRRSGLALDDVATDEKMMAHFAARRLAVEFVADWQELTGTNAVLNGTFDVLIYPSGTFVKALEDVVNLSAIYDAASLTVNEYTGVFFEQGLKVAKAGYGSSKITIPVNTAGETGAHVLVGAGDRAENGSF